MLLGQTAVLGHCCPESELFTALCLYYCGRFKGQFNECIHIAPVTGEKITLSPWGLILGHILS